MLGSTAAFRYIFDRADTKATVSFTLKKTRDRPPPTARCSASKGLFSLEQGLYPKTPSQNEGPAPE